MSALLDLAKPHRIKASHRRRRMCASGHRVYIMNNPLSRTDPTGYDACDADDSSCSPSAGQTKQVQQEVTGSHIKETVGSVTGNADGTVSVSRSGDGPGATMGFGSVMGGNRASSSASTSNGASKGQGTSTPTVPTALPDGEYKGQAPLTGTYYFGGAGMDGSYVNDTIKSMHDAGISDAAAAPSSFSNGIASDVIAGVEAARYELPDYNKDLRQSDAGKGSSQFNLVGYSYGSLVAAQIANQYVKSGGVVNNLVLIGSPISEKFLATLRAESGIRNVTVMNLKQHMDFIHAGMSMDELAAISPVLVYQMAKGNGHFYYAPDTPVGHQRREDLAKTLYQDGLR